jgi:sec-independent protein translocase protein TatA
MGKIGLPELLVIIGIIILFFGGRRLGEIGKGIGEGIRNFKSAVKDDKPQDDKTAKPSA